ncbi:MAG: PQQ-binding-like beta-propeller repeat protein [Nitrospirota bacterium]|nr:PQQ-binding-like beta-propeller repeat protein [Nitrospirota bacterium]
MANIQWLSEAIGEVREWFRPTGREFVLVYQDQWVDGRRRLFYVVLIALAMIGYGSPLTAWAADLSPLDPVKPGKVVAAGVGYENAGTSTITVKTYDAENGAILSEETYELDVREDAASAGSQPRERIFAGGVGPGADGLSAFTLRVYDAATGRFLWEGILNLKVSNQESGSTHRVAAHLAPQATVTRVRNRGAIDGQPQFFLRAVDPATGQLVWTDQFSAGAGRLARAERVGRAVVGQTEGLAASSQQIQFHIRMLNEQDRQILWEDTIEPTVEETEMVAGHDDAAENLPAWRGEGTEGMKQEAI